MMDEPAEATVDIAPRPVLKVLLIWAALVIVVAGMKAASALIVPFLLALFLAILSSPALHWLCNHRVPQWLALVIVLAALCFAVVILANVGVQTIVTFSRTWQAEYQLRAHEFAVDIQTRAESYGLSEDDMPWNQWMHPNIMMRWFTGMMLAFSGLLSQTLMILVTTIFLLIEGATFPDKIRAISGHSTARLEEFRRVLDDVNSYMAIKTGTSLLTGAMIGASLWILGVDFPLLWGSMAFLLNFVPNIGSILAAIPAILLSLVQFGSFGMAAVVTGVFIAVNAIIGYIIEPRWMGRGLGLSTLVVFVSLVFWGWVLGPVGMVISIPLTMASKIALENSEETRWLAILMGPSIPSAEQA